MMAYASWSYGSQLVTIIVQFAYAAVTSRIVDQFGFGEYALALAVGGLVGLLVNGGVGQAASRAQSIFPGALSALALYSLMLGVVGSVALFATADLWANLWGVPSAGDAVRFLSMSVLIAPLSGLANGLLRRQSRFRATAIIAIVANVLGMVAGLLAVLNAPTAQSLLVSPIVAMLVQGSLGALLNWRLLFAVPSFAAAFAEYGFGWKATGANVLAYLNKNIGLLAISRGVGVDTLGQWNRADVLTTVPMLQLQGALHQVLYPELRHDTEDPRRAQVAWTDMLILVAWIAFPIAAILASVAPLAIPILFGEGWGQASLIAVPLAIGAGLHMLWVTLTIAFESTAKFAWVTLGHFIGLAISVTGAVATIATERVEPVLWALLIAPILQHAVQVGLAHKGGYLLVGRLTKGYFQSGLFGILTFACASAPALLTPSPPLISLIYSALMLAALALLVLALRKGLPPVKIVRRYLDRD